MMIFKLCRCLLSLSFCVDFINASSLYFSSSPSEDGNNFPSYNKVSEAIGVLRSIGVKDLCHPTTDYFDILPVCDLESNDNIKRIMLESGEGEFKNLSNKEISLNIIGVILCIIFAALAAGLTMGMVSLEAFDLHVKIRTATCESERQEASTLVPIVEQRHRLLVTLLLLNSLSNEALPLFLDKLVPSYAAVLLSVTFVLFFGEIIPSAVFTGPNQTKMAAMCVPFVQFIMWLFTPLAVPIASVLDYVLGHEDKMYDREELTALVRVNYEERRKTVKIMQAKERKSLSFKNSIQLKNSMRLNSHFNAIENENSNNASIHIDEVMMMEGALQMKTITAADTMKPLEEVYTLPHDFILTRDNISKVYLSGYSRIPVYDYTKAANKEEAVSHICGVLLSKQLMVVDPAQKRALHSMPLQQPLCIPPQINLVDLLNIFQQGRSSFKAGGHLAVVCENPNIAISSLEKGTSIAKEANVLGIVTLEDVLEQLLQEDIMDETDYEEIKDVNMQRKVVKKWRNFVINKKLGRGEDVGKMSFGKLISSVVSEKIRRDNQISSDDNENAPLLTENDGVTSYGEP